MGNARILLGPPPLPHEHGAWAMLAIPLLLGLAASWPPAAPAWLLVPAMALLFLSRHAAMSVASRLLGGKKAPEGFVGRRIRWSVLEIGGATLLIAAAWRLTTPEARRGLLVTAAVAILLAAVHTGLAFFDRDGTVPGRMLGMAALASGAPLIAVAAGRPLDRRAVGTGLVALLYFATSQAYVKAIRGLWKGDRVPRKRCLGAHVAVAYALAMLMARSFIPELVGAAFAPVYARTAWGLFRPPSNLRVLGWREVGVATLFTLIAVAAYVLASRG
jgi:hypothetical protein